MPISFAPEVLSQIGAKERALAEKYGNDLLKSFHMRLRARHLARWNRPSPTRKWYGARYRLGPIHDWLSETAPDSTSVFEQFGWVLPDFEVGELSKRLATDSEKRSIRVGNLVQAIADAQAELESGRANPNCVLCGRKALAEILPAVERPKAKQMDRIRPIREISEMPVYMSMGAPENSVFVYDTERMGAETDEAPDVVFEMKDFSLVLRIGERFGITHIDGRAVRHLVRQGA